MVKDDTDSFTVWGVAGRQQRSILRRLLSTVFAKRYTVKMDGDIALDAGTTKAMDEVQTCMHRGKIIKSGDNIDVCRAAWQGRDVVVKWYKHVSLLHSLRYTFKRSRARRAWTNGRRLLALDVATPRPLAYIDEHCGPLLWQSCLVTEYVGSPMLDSVLRDPRVPDGRKRRMIHQTLRLIDRLGLHGVNHSDMKHTNILWNGSRIVLTDLDGMEVHRLPWLQRQRRGRDIARFLRGITTLLRQEAETHTATQSRESSHCEPSFVRRKQDTGTLWVCPYWRNEKLEKNLLGGQEALARHFQLESVPSAESSCVCRFRATFDRTENTVFLKEYLPRSALDGLKHLFRPARAMRAMRASEMLKRHGFNVAEVLMMGKTKTGVLKDRSFLATLEIANARPVYDVLAEEPEASEGCSLQEKRQLLRQLGHTIGRMHRDNILHGDLRLRNVLARKSDGSWELFLLDNERTRKLRRLWAGLRLKNLVQVNMLPTQASNTDRLRLFRAYLLVNPGVRLSHTRWAARITAITRRRFRKKGWS